MMADVCAPQVTPGRLVCGLLLVGCLVLPLAHAAIQDALQGRIDFSSAILEGDSEATTPRLGALHALPEKGVLRGELSASASEIQVKWLFRKSLGVGTHPDDPDRPLYEQGPAQPQEGTDSFGRGSISFQLVSSMAGLLAIPKPSASVSLEANASTSLSVTPASGQRWVVGEVDNNSRGAGSPPMIFAYATVAGQPVLRTQGALTWAAHGDLILSIWGANLTVQGDTGSRNYRTGAWWENATGPGPRGTVRDEYRQLVEVHLSDATLTWHHRAGIAQWTAPEAYVRTNGTAVFEQARGSLWSPTHRYDADGQTVRIEGNLQQRLSLNPSFPGQLVSEIEASQAQVDLEPSAAVPKSVTASDRVLWRAVVVVALAFMLALGLFGVRRWRTVGNPDDWLVQAQMALSNRNTSRAMGLARRLLRHQPNHAEAWFVYGAGLLQRESYARLVGEFDPLPDSVKQSPAVAWVLGLSYFLLGRKEPALRWLAFAGRSPEFLQELQESPLLADLRRDERFQRRLGMEPSPAYA